MFVAICSDLSAPDSIGDGIGTFSRFVSGQVVKASAGHYPQPFLIRDLKNCCKDRGENNISKSGERFL